MSATARRYNKQVPEYAIVDDKPGLRLDKGPYIGKVKASIDPLRKGRLSVFVEGFGGNEDDESQWRIVNYCSPYFGQTSDVGKSVSNDFANTNHSYGMWFTPPDIDTKVLCTFVNGDPNQGYYFACIPDMHNHHMVPGLASSNTAKQDDKRKYNSDTMPVVEFNDRNESLDKSKFTTNEKPANPILVGLLMFQGLFRDTIRGLTTSSSKRESPSRVFGINTPGRPYPEAPIDEAKSKATTEAASQKPKVGVFRFPGHSFVMDDGDVDGDNNLVRLRSSSGHQILMHDTEGVLYIANSTGSAWMEFRQDGKIDVYSADSISYYAGRDFNISAERSVNIQSKGPLNLLGDGATYIEGKAVNIKGKNSFNAFGGTTANLKGGGIASVSGTGMANLTGAAVAIKGAITLINGGGAVPASGVQSIQKNTHPKIGRQDREWVQSGTIDSVATRVPQHEPFDRALEFSPKSSSTGSGIGFGTVLQIAGVGLTALGNVADKLGPLTSTSNLEKAFGGFGSSIGKGIQTISETFDGILDSVDEFFGPSIDGVVSTFNEIKAEITDVVETVTSTDIEGEIIGAINDTSVDLVTSVTGDVLVNNFGDDIIVSELVSSVTGTFIAPIVSEYITDTGINSLLDKLNLVKEADLVDVANVVTDYLDVPYLTTENATLLISTLGVIDKGVEEIQNYDFENIKLNGTVELGKYRFDLADLQDLGYVKPGTNLDFNDPDVWTGKDGILDKSKFLLSDTVQESGIVELISTRSNKLIEIGGIKPEDDEATIAGMMAVSKVAGPIEATKWRDGQLINSDYDNYFAQANAAVRELGTDSIVVSRSNIVNSSTYDPEYAARVEASRLQDT